MNTSGHIRQNFKTVLVLTGVRSPPNSDSSLSWTVLLTPAKPVLNHGGGPQPQVHKSVL